MFKSYERKVEKQNLNYDTFSIEIKDFTFNDLSYE